MKECIYSVSDGKLVCNYETYGGKKGTKTFTMFMKKYDEVVKQNIFSFKEEGTKYVLGRVTWCNLMQCYTVLYNNTRLTDFIRCDLTIL